MMLFSRRGAEPRVITSRFSEMTTMSLLFRRAALIKSGDWELCNRDATSSQRR
jgi:hypothetical protein